MRRAAYDCTSTILSLYDRTKEAILSAVPTRLVARIDGMVDEICSAVAAFIRVPSVTPDYPGVRYEDHVGGESDAAALIGRLYREAGADVAVVSETRGRDNVVGVVPGGGGGRSLMFNGHLDVVPAGNEDDWYRPPFSGDIADGRLHGRGAADQKSGVIAQAFALVALHREGVQLRGDLVACAVAGEETGNHAVGTTAVLDRGFTAAAAIVSEPTAPPAALSVCPVSSGLMWFTLRVPGRAAHVSMRGRMLRSEHSGGPVVAANAIEKALLLISELQDLEREWISSKTHELFEPGHFHIHPGVIDGAPTGSQSPYTIADSCRIEYCVYYPPTAPAEEIRVEIEERIRQRAKRDRWLTDHPPVIDWNLDWPALNTDPSEDIVQCVLRAHRSGALGGSNSAPDEPSSLAAYHALGDASWIQAAGIPTLVYGPGSVTEAHQPNEWVAVDDMVSAAKTYALAAVDWCGS